MYTYSHTNTSPVSSNAESTLLNDLIAKWQKEHLEEIRGEILAASSDLHLSYELMNSALELIKDLPDEQRPVDSEDISSVEAAKEQALKYWKNFEAISDFSDSPKEIVNSLRSLFQKEEFPSDCWGILMGTEIAASIFRKSGICQITKHDEETGDKYEIYGEDNFTLKSTFSNLLDFFWYLGRRFRILEGAGPVCFDLERLQNIREGLLSALNDMMAAEPEDFPMNEREYFKCVEAIQAAMQAERMLEEQAKNAFVSADSMKKWKNYCRSYEGDAGHHPVLKSFPFFAKSSQKDFRRMRGRLLFSRYHEAPKKRGGKSMKKEISNAMYQIQKELRAPGHKEELREYNNSRRGDRIAGTRVQATKIQKSRSRQSLRQNARREIREAGY